MKKHSRQSLVVFISMIMLVVAVLSSLASCSGGSQNGDSKSGWVYVKPSVDYKGKYRKGHVRRSVSTKKDAYKSRARSRYYYQTRGKYRRKKD
jgi:hypothetical protein